MFREHQSQIIFEKKTLVFREHKSYFIFDNSVKESRQRNLVIPDRLVPISKISLNSDVQRTPKFVFFFEHLLIYIFFFEHLHDYIFFFELLQCLNLLKLATFIYNKFFTTNCPMHPFTTCNTKADNRQQPSPSSIQHALGVFFVAKWWKLHG